VAPVYEWVEHPAGPPHPEGSPAVRFVGIVAIGLELGESDDDVRVVHELAIDGRERPYE
jgi:hypothetical protein